MFLALPSEVRQIIVAYLCQRDLKAVCQVSKNLHEVALPLLYKAITFQLDEEFILPGRYHVLLTISKKYYSLVREIAFESASSNLRRYSCPHELDFDAMDPDDDQEELETELDDFGRHLLNHLTNLGEGSLRRFRWGLRTCVPNQILGKNGYLSKYQHNLEDLSLVTHAECISNLTGKSMLDLSFPRLCSLSWLELRTCLDLKSLGALLAANANTLKSLAIGFSDWVETEYDWADHYGDSDNFFAFELLNLEQNQSNCLFPHLESLSLRNFHFDHAMVELIHSLNFGGLRTLRLWNCRYTDQLLEQFGASNLGIELTAFEIVNDTDRGNFMINDYIQDFLGRFTGLEDLYIVIPGPMSWDFASIAGHHNTLNRLVIHDRQIDIDEDSPRFEEVCDGNVGWSTHLKVLTAHILDCFGVSNSCEYLLNMLRQIRQRSETITCKILHVRSSKRNDEKMFVNPLHDLDSSISWSDSEDSATAEAKNIPSPKVQDEVESFPAIIRYSPSKRGSPYSTVSDELAELADWVFGNDGFPQLKIIAYGDFSYRNRFAAYNVLLCRNETALPWSFRLLNESDTYLWNLVNDNLDMLGACPVDDFVSDLV